jgi:hypothetical protein
LDGAFETCVGTASCGVFEVRGDLSVLVDDHISQVVDFEDVGLRGIAASVPRTPGSVHCHPHGFSS